MSPPGSGIILDHAVTTVAEGQPSRISLERMPGSNMLRVSGQMAVGAPAISEDAAVPNPTILYLNALREALARNGIFVGGNPLDIDDARVKPDYAKATLLLEDRSATLASIIDVCLKWSRNEYAETMLRSLAPAGAARRLPKPASTRRARDAREVGRRTGAVCRSRRIGLVAQRLPVT